jgi:phosphoesterase RecJ-like protein
VLEALGKQAVIVNGQPTPPNLAFIDPMRKIQVLGREAGDEELRRAEVLVILDTSSWAQLGPMADVVRGATTKKLVIDHHLSEDDLGAVTFKDAGAEATGRLVFEAAQHLGVALTAEIAAPLFAAVATDTGWFRFPSTSSETYELAARLIDAGAEPHIIYGELYEQDTLGRIRLRGVVLQRIATEMEGRLAHTHIRKEDFDRTGALPSDTEDLVNIALEIAGVQVAVIFVEQRQGGFKISFRSRCQLDCSRLAAQFGGGGHQAAAGAFVKGAFTQVQREVLSAVRAAMR